MADHTETATADSTGTAVVNFETISPGLQWVISQISLETTPFRVGASCVVRRGGRYLTSTIIGSGDTAYGPPSIILLRGVLLTCTWTGLTQGDEAIATIWYEEQPWSNNPSTTQVV